MELRERRSINALIAELQSLTGSDLEPEHAPAQRGDVRHSLADISEARERLGYEPRVDVRSGLVRTYAYEEEQRRASAARALA